MKAIIVHPSSRFVVALLPLVCLVAAACTSSSGKTPQATPIPTASTPTFAAKLQPLLQSKMQQYRIPGAIAYVDIPGQGTW